MSQRKRRGSLSVPGKDEFLLLSSFDAGRRVLVNKNDSLLRSLSLFGRDKRNGRPVTMSTSLDNMTSVIDFANDDVGSSESYCGAIISVIFSDEWRQRVQVSKNVLHLAPNADAIFELLEQLRLFVKEISVEQLRLRAGDLGSPVAALSREDIELCLTDLKDASLVNTTPQGSIVFSLQAERKEAGDVSIVCFLCARFEEGLEARKLLEEENCVFRECYDPFPYWEAHLARFHIRVVWPQNQGPIYSLLKANEIVRLWAPRLLVMTGVAAGDRKSTKLGDLVVAQKAFFYETGKWSNGGFAPEFEHASPNSEFIRAIAIIAEKEEIKADLKERWKSLLEQDPSFEILLWRELHTLSGCGVDEFREKFRKLSPLLQNAIRPLIVANGQVVSFVEHVQQRISTEKLLFQGPAPIESALEAPKIHFGTYGTGMAVRGDETDSGHSWVFEQCQKVDRKTLAVDMEAAAVLLACAHSPTNVLVVKGVSDHADSKKNDDFHRIGKRLSAFFAFRVALEWMNCTPEQRLKLELIPDGVVAKKEKQNVQDFAGPWIRITKQGKVHASWDCPGIKAQRVARDDDVEGKLESLKPFANAQYCQFCFTK